MICPKCKELNQKSQITQLGCTVTCMYFQPYYDEEGKLHNHDANTYNSDYRCTNGHRILVTGTGKCSSCNWGHDSVKITVQDEQSFFTVESSGNIVVQ